MRSRRYVIELFSAMAGYAVLLAGAVYVLKTWYPPEPWRTVTVLTPMLAICVVAWTILREFRRLDEMQLRIQLEALAIAVALTSLVTLGWGFLETIGYPHFPTFAVWPLLAVGWMGGALFACRRYR
jgi:uncharacterized membrane protein YcjF (UPF0283 family)